MLRRNVGRLDRTLRLLVGFSLVPTALFALRGADGNMNMVGVLFLVAAFAVMPILTGLTGFCPAYLPFGVSTVSGGSDVAEPLKD